MKNLMDSVNTTTRGIHEKKKVAFSRHCLLKKPRHPETAKANTFYSSSTFIS